MDGVVARLCRLYGLRRLARMLSVRFSRPLGQSGVGKNGDMRKLIEYAARIGRNQRAAQLPAPGSPTENRSPWPR